MEEGKTPDGVWWSAKALCQPLSYTGLHGKTVFMAQQRYNCPLSHKKITDGHFQNAVHCSAANLSSQLQAV